MNFRPRTSEPVGRVSLTCASRVLESIESSELQTAERQLTVTMPARSEVGIACSDTEAPTARFQQS